MNINQTLQNIQSLFEKQLNILTAINQSFTTKQEHITTTIDGTQYVIPSFISLENKINFLQSAFDNLVNSAQTGEAWFNFDGNSRAIQVRSYQAAPSPVSLTKPVYFGSEDTTVFKDMLSPTPSIKIDLSALPDDITSVVVKKIILYNETLQVSFPNSVTLEEVYDLLNNQTEDYYISGVDYREYDSTYKLPIRKLTAYGNYTVTEVVDDTINSNLEEVITVKVSTSEGTVKDNKLQYRLADGASLYELEANDILTNFEGSCRLKIQSLKNFGSYALLELLVMSGEYVNIIPNSEDYSKLMLYRVGDYTDDKYINIPLEEDRYIIYFVAGLDDRLNVQSEFSNGIFLDVDSLIYSNNNEIKFRDYYEQSVKNIGDILSEMGNIAPNPLTELSTEEYTTITTTQPVLTEDTLDVIQINKHLNDAEATQNIRNIYKQKRQYQTELDEIDDKIQSLQNELSTISFDDLSGTRDAYSTQINTLKKQRNTINTNIKKCIDEIANAANDMTAPINSSKYHIRGYIDVDTFIESLDDIIDLTDIIGIQVEYRYKNPDIPQANVQPIGMKNFIFTEWTRVTPPYRLKNMTYSNGSYTVSFKDIKDDSFIYSDNNQKFNQIDIPISQGETVDIRVRVVYSFGYPYAEITSAWSEVLNVEFPDEFADDVEIKTILEENNDDIETNRFNDILDDAGLTDHAADKVVDQNITYFHKPEYISSGFYTAERRVIPLKDKLLELSNKMVEVEDTLLGSNSTALQVTFTANDITTVLQPDINNTVILPAYLSVAKGTSKTGSVYKDDSGVVNVAGMLKITNTTSHSVRLYSLFPGGRDKFVGGKYPTLDSSDSNMKSASGGLNGDTTVDAVTNYNSHVIPWDYKGFTTDSINEESSSYSRYIDINSLKEWQVSSTSDSFPTNSALPPYGVSTDRSVVVGLKCNTTFNSNTVTSAVPGAFVSDNDAADGTSNIQGLTIDTEGSNAGYYYKLYRNDNSGTCIMYQDTDSHMKCDFDVNTTQSITSNISSRWGYKKEGVGISWQRCNQYIYFRRNNPYDGSKLSAFLYNFLHQANWLLCPGSTIGMRAYPYLSSKYALCMDTDAITGYKVLAPDESVTIPINIIYRLIGESMSIQTYNDMKGSTLGAVKSTKLPALTSANFVMGFNIRNSLYTDPLYYQFTLTASYNQTAASATHNAKVSVTNLSKYNTTVV